MSEADLSYTLSLLDMLLPDELENRKQMENAIEEAKRNPSEYNIEKIHSIYDKHVQPFVIEFHQENHVPNPYRLRIAPTTRLTKAHINSLNPWAFGVFRIPPTYISSNFSSNEKFEEYAKQKMTHHNSFGPPNLLSMTVPSLFNKEVKGDIVLSDDVNELPSWKTTLGKDGFIGLGKVKSHEKYHTTENSFEKIGNYSDYYIIVKASASHVTNTFKARLQHHLQNDPEVTFEEIFGELERLNTIVVVNANRLILHMLMILGIKLDNGYVQAIDVKHVNQKNHSTHMEKFLVLDGDKCGENLQISIINGAKSFGEDKEKWIELTKEMQYVEENMHQFVWIHDLMGQESRMMRLRGNSTSNSEYVLPIHIRHEELNLLTESLPYEKVSLNEEFSFIVKID
jgi:hypothetical protein